MLRRMTRIVAGMVVNDSRMAENLNRSRGVVFSGTVLLELAKKGVKAVKPPMDLGFAIEATVEDLYGNPIILMQSR